MEHIPTTESDVEEVIRIAKVLGIGIEEAAITCDAFHMAFSHESVRSAIFGMIDELDESAARKGEPLGLIINYTVELGMEGIRAARYADEIPAGEMVELVPPHRANIFLRIVDNFPTQEFLGPLIVNRPGWHFDTFDPVVAAREIAEEEFSESVPGAVRGPHSESVPGAVATGAFSDDRKSQIEDPKSNGEVVCSHSETTRTEILLGPSSLESPQMVICLGPIRLKFNERFPFVASGTPRCRSPHVSKGLTFNVRQRWADRSSPENMPPWAALQAGTPAVQSMSGLSPPLTFGESGTLRRERCPAGLRLIDVETYVSHLDL